MKDKMQLIWLDDKRDPFLNPDWLKTYSPIDGEYKTNWVKSHDEFVDWILENGLPDAICFDHDLGDKVGDEEKTGYDCAKWLVNYCLDNDKELPLWNIQSSNTPGRDNINGLFISFLKHIKK